MDDVRKDMDVDDRQETFEVIAAFVDGERVDTLALRAALADEAGRDYLIDLVAMREIVGSDPGLMGPANAVPASRHWGSSAMGLAAVLALAIGVAGYAVGQQRSQVVTVAVLPPLTAEIIVAMEAPPAPTQVIRLGSGAGGR